MRRFYTLAGRCGKQIVFMQVIDLSPFVTSRTVPVIGGLAPSHLTRRSIARALREQRSRQEHVTVIAEQEDVVAAL
jgi:hypothetical protein